MKLRFNNDRNCLETNIYFSYNNGKRGSRIIRGNSKKEIEEKASQFLAELSKTSLLSSGLTLQNWFNYYINHICPSINKQSTIDNKVNIFKPLPEHMSSILLNLRSPVSCSSWASEALIPSSRSPRFWASKQHV